MSVSLYVPFTAVLADGSTVARIAPTVDEIPLSPVVSYNSGGQLVTNDTVVLAETGGRSPAGAYQWGPGSGRWQFMLDYQSICSQLFGVSDAYLCFPNAGDTLMPVGDPGAASVLVSRNGVKTTAFTTSSQGIVLDTPVELYEMVMVVLQSPITATTPVGETGTVVSVNSVMPDVNGNVLLTAAQFPTLAPLASPTFTGVPSAPTATAGTNTAQVATTAFVGAAISAGGFLTSAVAASTYAPLASPALTGTPTAPTATAGTSTTQVATTAFATAALDSFATFVSNTYSPVASPTFTGVPAAPTASPGTSTTQVATTAFVGAAITAGGFLTTASAASTYAPLASPALTGSPTAPTATAGTNTTQIATTAFVAAAITTAQATATTQAPGDNSTHVATTAFVQTATGAYLPLVGGALTGPLAITGAAGTARAIKFETAGVLRWELAADIEPESGSNAGSNLVLTSYSDAGASLVGAISINRASGVTTFGVTPTHPTPTAGDNSQNSATTAFVQQAKTANAARTSSAQSTTVGLADYYVGINFAGASTVNLPGASYTQGQTLVIKDESGAAQTNHITITTGGPLIDGQTSIVLAVNYGSLTLLWNNSFWSIV
jgi:hypothetical protein